jgi:hypothetical protein
LAIPDIEEVHTFEIVANGNIGNVLAVKLAVALGELLGLNKNLIY